MMGAAGALYKRRALAHSLSARDRTGITTLNLELPQCERNRRGNAFSSPKNNYMAHATLTLGQVSGPVPFGVASVPAAGFKVVGDADV
jgi:hypothetical protein